MQIKPKKILAYAHKMRNSL